MLKCLPSRFPCDLSHLMIFSVENVRVGLRSCRHFRGRAAQMILSNPSMTVSMLWSVQFSLNLIISNFRKLWADWLWYHRPRSRESDWMLCADALVAKVYCLWHFQSPPYLSWSKLMNSIENLRPYQRANSLVAMDPVFHPIKYEIPTINIITRVRELLF